MKKLLTIAFGLIAATVAASATVADAPKPLYKTLKLSVSDVAVSCKDGSVPKVALSTDGTYIVVSCK